MKELTELERLELARLGDRVRLKSYKKIVDGLQEIAYAKYNQGDYSTIEWGCITYGLLFLSDELQKELDSRKEDCK